MSVKAITWAWSVEAKPTEKLMLLALADHANDEDFTCWPSLTHLEKKTGLNRTTVWRSIDRLVELGAVTRHGTHASGATIYRVALGAQITYQQVHKSPRCTNHLGAESNQGRCAVQHDLGAESTPNHKSNHQEPSDRSFGSFDLFWSVYPKKVKKKPARALWERKKLDRIGAVLAKDVEKRLSKDKRWLDGYIPDPTTYLNQERWEDELQTATKNDNAPSAGWEAF